MTDETLREDLSSGYARLYGPMAVASVTLAFQPLFEDVVLHRDPLTHEPRLIGHFGSVFDMAGAPRGGPAIVGLLLLGAVLVALLVATFRPRSATPRLPITIAVFAATIAVMLIVKPGTGSVNPKLTGTGQAGLVLMLGMVVLGITHAVQLGRQRHAEAVADALAQAERRQRPPGPVSRRVDDGD